jgi:molecular chaperone IbpA
VTVQQNTLVVTGREAQKSDQDYLHRGIAARDFERRFSLADFVEVKEASF